MLKPRPEAHVRLVTIDGKTIERRLTDLSQPLVDESGFYRTATGGSFHAATESLPVDIYNSGRILHPGTVY